MSAPMNQDPVFAKSEEIKAEYLASGCQASDVDAAVERLMAECGELFEHDRAAWEFLMEEPHEDSEQADELSVRITIDINYNLGGASAEELLQSLKKTVEYHIDRGMLTGDTLVTVDSHNLQIGTKPAPLSEDVLAAYMESRIESSSLGLGDVPRKLAQYGLMEPDAFVSEMQERMSDETE